MNSSFFQEIPYSDNYAIKMSINKTITVKYALQNLVWWKAERIGIVTFWFSDRLSHFCGEAVCDDHSKKKRGDPDNPTEYHRICDTCEKKYINYIILKDFNKKLRERDDLLKQYEEKMKIMQKRISDAQRELDNSIVRVW